MRIRLSNKDLKAIRSHIALQPATQTAGDQCDILKGFSSTGNLERNAARENIGGMKHIANENSLSFQINISASWPP